MSILFDSILLNDAMDLTNLLSGVAMGFVIVIIKLGLLVHNGLISG